MGTVKSGKFWAGLVVGVILFYVYSNHMKGRIGG